MTRLVVDSSLPQKLLTVVQPVELCDESGRVLGEFVPRLNPEEYDLEPQISREEIERRKNSKEPRYTTAEVLARLEQI